MDYLQSDSNFLTLTYVSLVECVSACPPSARITSTGALNLFVPRRLVRVNTMFSTSETMKVGYVLNMEKNQ